MKYWIVAVLGLLGVIGWSMLKDDQQPLPDRQQWDTLMHVIDAESMRLLQADNQRASQTTPTMVKATWIPANNTFDLDMEAFVQADNFQIRQIKIHLNQTTTGHERTINGQLLPSNGLREWMSPDVMLGDKAAPHELAQTIAQQIRIAPHQAAELFLADQHIDPATCSSVLIEFASQEHTAILGGTSHIPTWRLDADCQNRHIYGIVNAINGQIEQ